MVRTAIYLRRPAGHLGTDVELCRDLRQAVDDRGGSVVATYIDDDGASVRNRNAQWKTLLANLGGIDQVVVSSAGDLPGKSIRDLLRVLGMLRDHGVSLYIHCDDIDTRVGSPFVVLDIGQAYRRDKLSKAIRVGQARCVAAGKVIGRPRIRPGIVTRIQTCLAEGSGIRSTARRLKISPGSVLNIRRQAMASLDRQPNTMGVPPALPGRQ
jgi:DNA invertase Pin-like site-specific DNA recombinase